MDALPEPYRAAAVATQRYVMYYGAVTDGDVVVTMFIDLADLWERAALDRTPLRDIVGENPVEFAEAFVQAYGGRQWIDKERVRLQAAFAQIEKGDVSR